MAIDAYTSAQQTPADTRPWWLGGQGQGPPAPTNPVRQWLGNTVETIGDFLPGREGYISEMIAGGPTRHTGYTYATDELPPTYDNTYNFSPYVNAPAPTPTPQPTTTNTGSYNFNMGDFPNYAGWDPNAAYNDWKAKGSPMPGGSGDSGGGDPYASVRNEISGGYDQYIGQLNNMLNQGLPDQAGNMNQIIGNQYASGESSLMNQQNLGLSDLGAERTQAAQNQSKNLKDISENLRNMFMSGNVFLGSRGAGDSSAANQYSYALTKVGNKARGDVMSQTAGIQAEIAKRETNLKQTVQSELQNLGRERDNKILEVSNWLAEQQNAIRDRIGQAGLSKSTDLANFNKSLLDQALQRLQQTEQDVKNKRSMLEEWAMNNATSINQLKSNLAAVSSYNPSLPQAQQFSGTPTISGGNLNTRINWSAPTKEEEEPNIFSQLPQNTWLK